MKKSFIKTILALLVCVCIALSFSGCRRFLGAGILSMFGVDFFPHVSNAEQYLSLDLSELDDTAIDYLDQGTYCSGVGYITVTCIYNDGLIKDIDARIKSAPNWTALPCDDDIKTLLTQPLKNEDLGYILDITDGYYSVSGSSGNDEDYDFDRANQSAWKIVYIGIYDSEKDRIYVVSVKRSTDV